MSNIRLQQLVGATYFLTLYSSIILQFEITEYEILRVSQSDSSR
jgi:hypothetical protein